MLPAESAHYRKGLTLGLTLAEIFSIVVFVLLVACAALLSRKQAESEAARAESEAARADATILEEELRPDNMSREDARRWIERVVLIREEKRLVEQRLAQAERALEDERAANAELVSLLDTTEVRRDAAERVAEQAVLIRRLEDSISAASATSPVQETPGSVAQASSGAAVRGTPADRREARTSQRQAEAEASSRKAGTSRQEPTEMERGSIPSGDRKSQPTGDQSSAAPEPRESSSDARGQARGTRRIEKAAVDDDDSEKHAQHVERRPDVRGTGEDVEEASPDSNSSGGSGDDARRAAALLDSLVRARRAVNRLDEALEEASRRMRGLLDDAGVIALVDSLRGQRDEALIQSREAERAQEEALARSRASERARNEAVGRAAYREAQLERLRQGSGIDPPPCWMDGTDPVYIFRVVLEDEGMRIYNTAPEARADLDPEGYGYAAEIEDGRLYSPGEFLEATLPFINLGRSRTNTFGPQGCRFWVRPVDQTGASKLVFRQREDQLWRRFWFRW